MEGHAALPDHEDFLGMFEEIAAIVERDIAKPSAQHHAQRAIDQEIVEALDSGAGRWSPEGVARGHAAGVEPAGDEANDIGEGVPADWQGPKPDRHRINARIGDREENHGFSNP